jgi:hypothetical protein
MLQFGGSNANVLIDGNNANITTAALPTEAPITAWASANHGSWASSYGDQNSQYIRVCRIFGEPRFKAQAS